MPPMPLERLDPRDDQAFADVLALETAALARDRPYAPPPTPTAARAFRRYGWDDGPATEWLCRDSDGRLLGTVGLHLPTRDNLHAVFGGVLVHPERRRQGLGRRLFAQLLEVARQPGRRLLISGSRDAPGLRGFAEAMGFSLVSTAILRRQDLRRIDWGHVDTLRGQARAAARDYTLWRFTEPVPEELVEEVAAMESAINDAPRDDLAIEDDVFTPERVRARERSIGAAGLREYRLIARRERDGALAGHTVVHVDPEQPEYGGQGDTSVLGAHRGRRLGMLLKSEMMFWLADAEPQLRWVDTGNAESNRHMIAINEALGYHVLDRNLGWQRDL